MPPEHCVARHSLTVEALQHRFLDREQHVALLGQRFSCSAAGVHRLTVRLHPSGRHVLPAEGMAEPALLVPSIDGLREVDRLVVDRREREAHREVGRGNLDRRIAVVRRRRTLSRVVVELRKDCP